MIRDTQKAAWSFILPKLAQKQREVLLCVAGRGSEGATIYDVSESLKWPLNSVSGRLTELEDKGAIFDSTRRRASSYSGKPCVVWVAIEKDQMELL